MSTQAREDSLATQCLLLLQTLNHCIVPKSPQGTWGPQGSTSVRANTSNPLPRQDGAERCGTSSDLRFWSILGCFL